LKHNYRFKNYVPVASLRIIIPKEREKKTTEKPKKRKKKAHFSGLG